MAEELCSSANVTPAEVLLNIASTPTGAQVWFKDIYDNWINTGAVTPASLQVTASTTYTIQLRKIGYTTIEDIVPVGVADVSKSYTLKTVGLISIESITFNDTEVMVGEFLTCTVTVKNVGGSPLTNLKYASYTLNGGAMTPITFPDILQPGQITSKTFNLTTNTPGQITLCAYSNFI